MDLERLVALVVKTVIEELVRQNVIRPGQYASTHGRTESPAVPPVKKQATGRVVSAQMILDAAAAGAVSYEAPPGALITPLAADVAREKGIRILKAGKG